MRHRAGSRSRAFSAVRTRAHACASLWGGRHRFGYVVAVSDHAEVLVCRVEEPYGTAARVIARLVARQIIEPMPSDCVLASLGHRPGPRVGDAAEHLFFLDLAVNGMELRLPGRVELFFPSDGGLPSVSCPRCEQALDGELLLEHLEPHNPFKLGRFPTCPACGESRAIEDWITHGSAFGNLAFVFWNWSSPLRATFLADMEEWCGRPVSVVHEHI